MKIRDGYARINGDDTEYDLPSDSLEIIADDGRVLFDINMLKDAIGIDLRSGDVCKHKGEMLDDRFSIQPVASNMIRIIKEKYPS